MGDANSRKKWWNVELTSTPGGNSFVPGTWTFKIINNNKQNDATERNATCRLDYGRRIYTQTNKHTRTHAHAHAYHSKFGGRSAHFCSLISLAKQIINTIQFS